jgi:hypothetical protein
MLTDFRRKEKDGLMKAEPLLIPDKSRFVLFPIQHTDVSSVIYVASNA